MERTLESNEAAILEYTWRTQHQTLSVPHRKDLLPQIAASLRFLPDEIDDPLLQLPWYSLKKQYLFTRYRVSINVLLWFWALREVVADQARDLLQSVEPLYSATRPRWSVSWRQLMIDLDFFLTILDNYREEGFLSVAQHVVWRVHGDFVKDPSLLEVTVALMFHMDRTFEEFRVNVHQWAGRECPGGTDRITGLLEGEAFSGNF
ncbi:MAG: hypothetical protein HQL84_02640 [Magnetococcales bacterium]|nr:hypothetical protein [Magnetococcales bacterium]MBF0148923.1 hypothetical protein [Magnetococcales bacterium]MBF0173928.1 hypothetical protein [Magnetococcales bacterium]MBF0629707.1 hypothetical protein [Magnetococcales bacterium]